MESPGQPVGMLSSPAVGLESGPFCWRGLGWGCDSRSRHCPEAQLSHAVFLLFCMLAAPLAVRTRVIAVLAAMFLPQSVSSVGECVGNCTQDRGSAKVSKDENSSGSHGEGCWSPMAN